MSARLFDLDKSQTTFSSTTPGGRMSPSNIDDPEGDASATNENFLLDEHRAIAGLSGTLILGGTPQSPAQLVSQIDSVQRQEFEALRQRLEEEHRCVSRVD